MGAAVIDLKALTWYLAGPMSGIPQHNIPMFDASAGKLREEGWTIVSPAELDDEEVRAASLADPDGSMDGKETIAGQTWGDFLARDVKLIADGVDGIIFLPGWQESRGACLEGFVGLLTGKQFMAYGPETGSLTWLLPDAVRKVIL